MWLRDSLFALSKNEFVQAGQCVSLTTFYRSLFYGGLKLRLPGDLIAGAAVWQGPVEQNK